MIPYLLRDSYGTIIPKNIHLEESLKTKLTPVEESKYIEMCPKKKLCSLSLERAGVPVYPQS